MSIAADRIRPLRHFLGSEIEQGSPADSRFQVIPAPLERSVSYGGGTGNGPAAILSASWQLEKWDGRSRPCDDGIYTHDTVDCRTGIEQVIDSIAGISSEVMSRGCLPILLGGEHTATLGAIRGIADSSSGDFGVVQFDAHADLRDTYLDDPYSHASVMRRVVDLDIPLVQLGVRALCEEEVKTRKRHSVICYDADELVPQNVSTVALPGDFPGRVYISIDVDGFDPSVFPATGTPVPGGLGWYQALGLIESIASQREVIGFDLVEFAPIEGFHCYDFAAATLIYKVMGIIQRNSRAR